MRGWCRVGGVIGNIKKPDEINWPVNPIRCNKHMCHCNFDIMCRKELPKNSYRVIKNDAD